MSAVQFATAFALRPKLVAWFLGAGASAASGIPNGYAMVRDFKARIFCREMKLSQREIDTGDPPWIERIDDFFRRTSLLPPDGDPMEYTAAFEAVYPQPRHRRQYIADQIAKGKHSLLSETGSHHSERPQLAGQCLSVSPIHVTGPRYAIL